VSIGQLYDIGFPELTGRENPKPKPKTKLNIIKGKPSEGQLSESGARKLNRPNLTGRFLKFTLFKGGEVLLATDLLIGLVGRIEGINLNVTEGDIIHGTIRPPLSEFGKKKKRKKKN